MGKLKDAPPRLRLKAGHESVPEVDKTISAVHAVPPKKSLAVRLSLAENKLMHRKGDAVLKGEIRSPRLSTHAAARPLPTVVRKPRSNRPRRPRVFIAVTKPTQKVRRPPSPSENDFLYILAQAGESLEREAEDAEVALAEVKPGRPRSVPASVRDKTPATTLRIKLKDDKNSLQSKPSVQAPDLVSPSVSSKWSVTLRAPADPALEEHTMSPSSKSVADTSPHLRKLQGSDMARSGRESRSGQEHHTTPSVCAEKHCGKSWSPHLELQSIEVKSSKSGDDMGTGDWHHRHEDNKVQQSSRGSPSKPNLQACDTTYPKLETEEDLSPHSASRFPRLEDGITPNGGDGTSTEEEEEEDALENSDDPVLGLKRPDSHRAPDDVKRLRRIEANREAARQTIRRKRAQHDSMLIEEKDLEEENAVLRKEIHSARQEVEDISNNIAFLQALLKGAEEKSQQRRGGDCPAQELKSTECRQRSKSRGTEPRMCWRQANRFADYSTETSREMMEPGMMEHIHFGHGHRPFTDRREFKDVPPSTAGMEQEGTHLTHQGSHMIPPWANGIPPPGSGSFEYRPSMGKGPPGYMGPTSQGFPGSFPPPGVPPMPPHDQMSPWGPGGPPGPTPWAMLRMPPGHAGFPPFPNIPPDMMAAFAASSMSPAQAAAMAAAMSAGPPPPPGLPPSMPPGMAAAMAANPMFFAGSMGGPPPPGMMMHPGMPLPNVNSDPRS
mmetsp:Transcript_13938/g.39467  ORF Transcript_13938/g.39467 Transcript_13938/m.39467 type:complete len:722 (+) Transcript_13938:367-2532(+)|eukprot:CAMPEP_0117697454 /NCGR_PEP_ID=MMETSP0804-20121206/29240_1 /TAXON_ID=1074897 /ORGANISM="Tetraselmis astigmatica, Strain CCMP880" /LENGTH=721 /DNA_ID=CAMNT_0005511711 /DNA_START=394 /DNA_END=2559 /DNA_ORIENTATION=-